MNRRRDALLRLAAAGAFGSAGLSGLIRQALAADRPPARGLHRLKGDVRINGEPAKEGQLIAAGDTVSTAARAEAIYVIGNDAFLQRENSRVSFGAELAKDFFRIFSGKLLSVFGSGAKTLTTPTATIGIRGTGCYIEAEDKQVYFCLCYGSAEIQPVAEPGRRETITTTYHDHPIAIHHDPKMPAMVNARVINHTDTELTLLESLCGRLPPFHGQGGYKY